MRLSLENINFISSIPQRRRFCLWLSLLPSLSTFVLLPASILNNFLFVFVKSDLTQRRFKRDGIVCDYLNVHKM